MDKEGDTVDEIVAMNPYIMHAQVCDALFYYNMTIKKRLTE